MSDQSEKLKTTVTELEDELHTLDTVDDEVRAVLREVIDEIRSVLDEDSTAQLEDESTTGRLQSAAQEFEGSHPTLSAIIGRVIDGLGQLGI